MRSVYTVFYLALKRSVFSATATRASHHRTAASACRETTRAAASALPDRSRVSYRIPRLPRGTNHVSEHGYSSAGHCSPASPVAGFHMKAHCHTQYTALPIAVMIAYLISFSFGALSNYLNLAPTYLNSRNGANPVDLQRRDLSAVGALDLRFALDVFSNLKFKFKFPARTNRRISAHGI